MLFGLVELHVDLRGLSAPSQTDAVIEGIRRDAAREAKARAAVEHARRLGCGFILMPGWTLVADTPPAWLLSLTDGVTVVAECLLPAAGPAARGAGKAKAAPAEPVKGSAADAESDADGDEDAAPADWRSHVLRDGEVVVGPARQHVAGSGDPWDGDVLAARGEALIRDLLARGPTGRRWTVPGVGEALLLLCGEANLVAGGGPSECWNYESVEAAGLTEAVWRGFRLIINPAHTRSGPQALRDKRAWLSKGGVLLNTGNTHSAGWTCGEREDAAAGRASHTAAAAWVKGEAAKLEPNEGDGYRVMTLDRAA